MLATAAGAGATNRVGQLGQFSQEGFSPTVLEQVPLFSGLSEQELAAVERQAVRKRYKRKTVIIEHGDLANTLYFMLSGKVKIYVMGEDGKEIVFRERGPGSYLGELALLAGGKRTASVETLEDSEFLVLTQDSFNRIMAEHPSIAQTLLRDLARRTCELSDDLTAFALLDVYGRIVKLLEGSAVEENGRLITPRLTHQYISDRIGSSREMVSKILKDLRIGGYIAVEQKRIVLLRPLPERW
jgi:CRP/FNR family cyclic AMP-dependent transcriptional regulator